jgi:hypothetical protein
MLGVSRRSERLILKDAGSKMTIRRKTRDLARRLLEYEAMAGESPESMESASTRVYEKLRQSLGEFVGAAGFHSLASRALALARPDAPSLSAARVTADGSFEDLGEIEPQIDDDKDQAGEYPSGGGGAILITRLLDLLLIFLGESLTLSLLRNAWPSAAFDDRNSVHGRKA